jgi:uncharacterized membrane protein YvbJ
MTMVYCTKCGTNNAEDATVCVNCGAPLYGASGEGRVYMGHVRYERGYGSHGRGGLIAGLIIGIVVIFIGLSFLLREYGIPVPWWEIIIIVLGIYLVWRWFRVWKRRK